MTDIVNLDVGGMHYSVAKSTIMKYEDTMLAKLVSKKWNTKTRNGDKPIFIDRNGERFDLILDFYRDGEIIVPNTVAIDAIKKDALFFGLPEDASIMMAKNTLSLKDFSRLWSTFRTLRAEMKILQLYDNAAFWAIEEFFKRAHDFHGSDICVQMSTCGYIGNIMNTREDRLKLVAAINKVIVSLEEEVLAPDSVSVEENNDRNFVRFRLNL
jgi:hypothetical protein